MAGAFIPLRPSFQRYPTPTPLLLSLYFFILESFQNFCQPFRTIPTNELKIHIFVMAQSDLTPTARRIGIIRIFKPAADVTSFEVRHDIPPNIYLKIILDKS